MAIHDAGMFNVKEINRLKILTVLFLVRKRSDGL